MTKMGPRQTDPTASIDKLRTALASEYIDIVLLHGIRTADWVQEREQTRDALSEAKQKKIVLAHGASVHGLVPLRTCPGAKWLDVALCRINHNGTMMDNMRGDAQTPGDVPEVTAHLREIHGQAPRARHEDYGRGPLHHAGRSRRLHQVRNGSGRGGCRHHRLQKSPPKSTRPSSASRHHLNA